MRASNQKRFGIAVVAAGLWLATAMVAHAPAARAASGDALQDLWVERDHGATVITLPGVSPEGTTARQDSEPQRLVVELPGVQAELPFDRVIVDDGLVDEIRIQDDGGPVRLEIGLSQDAAHELIALEGGMQLRLAARDGAVAEADAAEAALAETGSLEQALDRLAANPEDTVELPPVGTALIDVAVAEAAEDTTVDLVTDGPVGEVKSFALENPDRLVVDLIGVDTLKVGSEIQIGSASAERLRVGRHPDKLRLVFDAGSAARPFATHEIEPTANGLRIRLRPGQVPASVADAEPEGAPIAARNAETEAVVVAKAEVPAEPGATQEPAEAAEPVAMAEPVENSVPEAAFEPEAKTVAAAEPVAETPVATTGDEGWVVPERESGANRVHGIQFDPQPDRDRVVVVSDRVLEYEVVAPDDETLIVRLPGSALAPEAAVRLVPEEPGPVSMVSAFQQPDLDVPEARVVVRRTAGLEPRVTRAGTALILEFERGGVPAAPIPIKTAAASAPAAPEAGAVPAKASAAPATQPMVTQVSLPSPPASPAALQPDTAIDVLAEGGFEERKQYLGRRISLDFKDADINDILRLIADVSDLNVISGDEVKGKVTIRLVDVPWDQALDVILLTKGLGFERVGNVLRIAPSDLLKSEAEARLQERRAKEKLEDLLVKMQPVNYADVNEVQNLVKRLLTPRGSVDIDRRTNTVIIKDIASVIDESTALIKAIDTQTPQVLIEARIVEANLDFTRELGSTWSLGLNANTDPFDDTSAERRDLGSEDLRFHDQNNVVISNPVGGSAGLINLAAFLLDETFDLSVTLQAAESSGEGKVISSPRIVTLDNTEAKIEQGVSIPFQTFENGDAQLEFIDAVLSLSVTPHVTADRSVIMKLLVSRNAPDASVATTTGTPGIAKNQAETESLVKDGQTLVIGGIYVVDKSNTQQRVPYLHRIPILGALFRNNRDIENRDELLIFVTPRIVNTPDYGA